MKIIDLGNAFANEFSGIRSKNYIAELIKFHRITASPGITQAAQFIYQEAEKAGLACLQFQEYAVDGKSRWWTWKTPWYWTPKEAELWLVSPEKILLGRFSNLPCSLGILSGPTPAEGVTTEVVDVGKGIRDEDYEGKDVSGKIVLISGSGFAARLANKMAQKKGAIGIITDNIVDSPPVRTRVDLPEIIEFTRVEPEDDGSAIFSFAINHKQMYMLKELLVKKDSPPVKVFARVEAEIGKGMLNVVTGIIRGKEKPEEEVVLIAHMCHPAPSANDNASGCSLLLEMARALNKLIQEKIIPCPQRTIRFLWVPEFYGTLAYLYHNPEWPKRVIAVLNADMVGEDQIKCGGPLVIEKAPDILPSFLNDLTIKFLELLPKEGKSYFGGEAAGLWKYEIYPCGGGSDHAVFADPSIKVPSIMFGHWPDRFYHSSEDTLDKVDPEELNKVGWVMFQVAYFLANAGLMEGKLLAHEIYQRAVSRLSQRAAACIWKIRDAGSLDEDERNKAIIDYTREGIKALDHFLEAEQVAVDSVTRFLGQQEALNIVPELDQLKFKLIEKKKELTQKLMEFAEIFVTDASQLAYQEKPLTELEKELNHLTPIKKWTGPLNFNVTEYQLGWEKTAWLRRLMVDNISLRVIISLAAAWVDGKKSLWEIVERVKLGSGFKIEEEGLQALLRYFRQLEEIGLLEFKEAVAKV